MPKIIIALGGPGGMDHFGHDAMANTLCICDCILTDKKDGDTIKAAIEGTLMEHDGKRYISVDKVDGEDVVDPEMDGEDYQEPPVDDGSVPEHAMMDSMDALDNFMQKQKGK